MTQINEHLKGVDFTPSKLRVTELREELVARGMSPKGLKQDLVDRLSEAIKSEGSQSQATQEPQTQEVLREEEHGFEVVEKDVDVVPNPLDNQQPQMVRKEKDVDVGEEGQVRSRHQVWGRSENWLRVMVILLIWNRVSNLVKCLLHNPLLHQQR